MIGTLNFTGRLGIHREEAQITLRREAGDSVSFDAELDLVRLELPADANVFVEAAFKTTFMRFSWGTVARLSPPDDRLLGKLEQPDLAHFRVKVVESAAKGLGRLLAVADRIRPEGVRDGAKRRVSLLPVDIQKSLADEVWQLDFKDDAGPRLELAQTIQGINHIARQPAFMALVYPEAVRQILERAFKDGYDHPEFDRDSWQSRWVRFGMHHARYAPPRLWDNEIGVEHRDWINDVVAGFSRQLKLVPEYKRRFANTEAEQP